MKIQLLSLTVCSRKTTERIDFSKGVTFLHGPVSTGKSTVARLIDYCFGGDLERTPAIQQEFVAVELSVLLNNYTCTFERASNDTQSVRVTWSGPNGDIGSLNAPIDSQPDRLIDAEVYNLSDLIFYLCGVTPIKVHKRTRDPESPLIRLSIRDIWWYCYLDQTHLDSSFFRLEDPFRGRKSQDAMRFFTGLHSERLSQLEDEFMRNIDNQRSMREAVRQIRSFMTRFDMGSELDILGQLQIAEQGLISAKQKKGELEVERYVQTHPTDTKRDDLRYLSADIENMRQAINESKELLSEQKALRAELIATKIKTERAQQAGRILEGVLFERCPECGSDLTDRRHNGDRCCLCNSIPNDNANMTSLEQEALRLDLNERIDQIAESILRREREISRMERLLEQKHNLKISLDNQLQEELARYDSAFVESIRGIEREIATLEERIRSLRRLQQMPQAINSLEEEAGALQGQIDRLRTSINDERIHLRNADNIISEIATDFKRIMTSIGLPGVSEDDTVVLDPRNWKPKIIHNEQEYTFWDLGSGGKKTLFNVCYALAIHVVALERRLPVPSVLIIDSPTKNISEDENPSLVGELYKEIYRLASGQEGQRLQFLLIDSELVEPTIMIPDFLERRMAGEADAPSLIPYYFGP